MVIDNSAAEPAAAGEEPRVEEKEKVEKKEKEKESRDDKTSPHSPVASTFTPKALYLPSPDPTTEGAHQAEDVRSRLFYYAMSLCIASCLHYLLQDEPVGPPEASDDGDSAYGDEM